ncbi:MAG: DUF1015 domain-containing protein [Phycisphaerales bacterium]|nr:DUF1015 domain-containing protein [Phycisphaerales bacterium]
MLRIKPFAALRPKPGLETKIASVPYDVVDRDEARELSRDNPLSFLHVVRPDADLPDDVDAYDDRVYAQAQKAINKLTSDGSLIREAGECIYLYRQEMELLGRKVSQTGVVCCCHVEDYNRDIIKKHEKTRQDKEDDRTRHVLSINANAGPVFLMHKDIADAAALVAKDTKGAALYDFTAPDGVRHTIWKASEPGAYVKAFGQLPAAYVADGHHRSASAARAGAERKSKNPRHTGNEEYNWFLTVLFPASALTILPYNRIVKDLNGLSPAQLLDKIGAIAHVTPEVDPTPRSTGSFCMYLDGKWWNIELPERSIDKSDPIASLDYVLLYDRILAPMLGVGDIRKDKRIDFVGGIRGTGALKKVVDSGKASVAFSMHPTTVEQIIRVSDAGQIMPPKSTWFEPKLRSGLLVHTLD